MRHAEFSTAPALATLPTSATRPTAALGGGSGFGRAFAEVQDEVVTFIRDGGGMTLSVEGSMWHARTSDNSGAAIAGADLPASLTSVLGQTDGTTQEQQAFLDSIAPWAKEAADKLGVAPQLVAAHAALESGWGQRPIPGTGAGGTSHNLFGIKAGASWQGAVSETTTTEYVRGEAITIRDKFRAYPDAAGAFRDYASMLLNNPRYQGALNVGADANAFAQGLVRGGYATDPAYAAKLTRLAGKLAGAIGVEG